MRNFLSEMLYALTSAYSRKDYDNRQQRIPLETNIGKLFSILAQGLDSVEEKTEMVKLWDNLDYACGLVLDRYGANFGVKRISSDDRFYRLAIKVKVMAQLSGGDIDTVLNAAASLFSIATEKVDLAELFPAKIGIDIKEADLDPETLDMVEDIAAMLKRILAAGVGLITTLQSYREFKSDVNIAAVLFDRSRLTFNLPNAKRTFTRIEPVKNALFERTGLKMELSMRPQIFSQPCRMAFAVFEQSRLSIEPAARRRTYRETHVMSFVLFEYSRIVIRPVY